MVTVLTPPRVTPARDLLLHSMRAARRPAFRSMRDFAEQEIKIPTGEYEGSRFNCRRQPFAALWFASITWALSFGIHRFMAGGPTQTGKTLLCFAIPALFYAIEMGERVMIGVPDLNMSADKWSDDLLPVIEQTRYRELLPQTGSGSRGGSQVSRIQLANGGLFRFITGGSRGAGKMGITGRVLVMTELNELALSSGDTRLSDPVRLLEGRLKSYAPHRRRVFGESTHTDERGRVHQEIRRGTETRIALRCPHCESLVVPQREDLTGWRGQPTLGEVYEHAGLVCPSCGQAWSEEDRRSANEHAELVHRGQSIVDGEVVGEPATTDTLGFGWSCVNSMFSPMTSVAAQEWQAEQAEDAEDAERELCQQTWAIPYESPTMKVTAVVAAKLLRRVRPIRRGEVPAGAVYVTTAADVRTVELHWSAWAWWLESGRLTGNAIDRGIFPVPSDEMELGAALREAIRAWAAMVREGFKPAGDDGVYVPDQAWVDANWRTDEVVAAVKELEDGRDGRDGALFRPYQGEGEGQHNSRRYTHPRTTSRTVIWVGTEQNVVWDESRGICMFKANADYGKDRVHEGLVAPFVGGRFLGSPGALALYDAAPAHHHEFVRQLTAEERRVEFDEKRGEVSRWFKKRPSNHFLDTSWAALMAAVHLFDAERERRPENAADVKRETRPTDGGVPYLINQRQEL